MIPKITANGYALLLNALDGVGIQFSKIVVGNGEKPADYRVLSDLQNPILSAEITEITRMEKYAILRAPMLNSDVEGRLHWTELGVFTKDPAGGADILYGYAHTDLSGDGQGISVPSYDTNMIELAHIIYVYVGEVDDVTAIIAQSSEYASAAALSNHTTNTSNPHKVTAHQVGLGNVPNVTPENQQPVFSNTVTTVTTEEDGTKSLPNIQNGDTMGSILQKIRSAISALISHLNAKNPHGMVASDVGAAASAHYHSASDINKGTLSLLRGGTGGTTAEEARKNLEAAKSCDENGTAESAAKLYTARKVTVNLASEAGADFDGSKAITPGVSGILPIAHGGTGAATAEEARTKLGIITLEEIPNLYVWKRFSSQPAVISTNETNVRIAEMNAAEGNEQCYSTDILFGVGYAVVGDEIKIADSKRISVTSIEEANKYFKNSCNVQTWEGNLYYLQSSVTFSIVSEKVSDYLTKYYLQASAATKREAPVCLDMVAAKESDAYPTNGKHTDGYWYVYHKQLGE